MIRPVQISAVSRDRQHTARIGVHLRASGLIAIDVDPRNGGDVTFAKLEAEHGALPRTNHQQSGSGGSHIVMLDPSPGPEGWTRKQESGGRCRGKLGAGVDIKCNGYVVVEPSGDYRWLALDPHNVATVPDAWINLIRKPEAEPHLDGAGLDTWQDSTAPLDDLDRARLRELLTNLGPGSSGTSTTFLAIKTVCHDYGQSVEDGADLLIDWNRQRSEPHTSAELERQISRVASKVDADHERGWYVGLASLWASVPTWGGTVPTPTWSRSAAGSWGHLYATALDDVRGALGVRGGQSTIPDPIGIPAGEFLDRTYPPVAWCVRGLVKDRGTLLVGGEPKTCKTWVLSEMARALATGMPAFGKFETGAPKRGLYFYAEDLGGDIQAHFRALGKSAGMNAAQWDLFRQNLCIQPRGRFLDITRDEDLALIVASCRKFGGVDFVFLEPLRDLHSGKENESDDMAPVFKRLRVLGELLDATPGTAHHNKKNSESERGGQKTRGSSAIHGSIDSGIYLSDVDGNGQTEFRNKVESEIKGARSAGKFELTLKITDGPDDRSETAEWSLHDRTEGAGKEFAQALADVAKLVACVQEEYGRHRAHTRSKWRRDKELADHHGLSQERLDAAFTYAIGQGTLKLVDQDPWSTATLKASVVVPARAAERRLLAGLV